VPRRFSQQIVAGRGRSPARRSTAWSSSAVVTSLTAVPAASIILTQILIPTITEQTITRVRGMLTVKSDQQAASENQLGAFGMAVVEEPAATVGVTAVPQPITDAASEAWFVWFAIAQNFIIATNGATLGVQYVIDSKAMRKVNSEQRVVIVLENASATHAFQFWFHLRMLSILKS